MVSSWFSFPEKREGRSIWPNVFRNYFFPLIKKNTGRETKNSDETIVEEIMASFRNNDVASMEKLLREETRTAQFHERSEDINTLCWDKEMDRNSDRSDFKQNISNQNEKYVHQKLHAEKSVRFELEHTPKDNRKRAFTPLFTSTPRNEDTDSLRNEDQFKQLKMLDSNVMLQSCPSFSNTSSSVLANSLAMTCLQNIHQQTIDALSMPVTKNSYRICYDDTDEEEVSDKNEKNEEAILKSLLSTSPINKQGIAALAVDGSLARFGNFVDSNVVRSLDYIDNYINLLDEEINCGECAGEEHIGKAYKALHKVKILQKRFLNMNNALDMLHSKFPKIENNFNKIDSHGDHKIMSAFEDSCWAAQLETYEGNCSAESL